MLLGIWLFDNWLAKDTFLVVIALWGAVLSTITLLWKLSEYRRRLLIFCDADLDGPTGLDGQPSVTLTIRVCNIGQRPVMISELGFITKSKASAPVRKEVGQKLLDSEVHVHRIPGGELPDLDTIEAVYVSDGAKQVYSTPISDWTKDRLRLLPILPAVKTIVDVAGKVHAAGEAAKSLADTTRQVIDEVKASLAEDEREAQEIRRKRGLGGSESQKPNS